MVKVNIEFSGGMELLFGNKKSVEADVPLSPNASLTIAQVMQWAKDNLLTDRPEMFMKGDTVRPGILVLINDMDWELSGMEESILNEGDRITFISTLHGG